MRYTVTVNSSATGERLDMTDQAAVLWVRVTPSEGQIEDVIAMLRVLVGPAEAHPLCVRCGVERDSKSPNTVTFRHEWSNQTAMLQHVRDHDRRVLLEAIDLSSRVPEISLETVSTKLSGISILTDMDGR